MTVELLLCSWIAGLDDDIQWSELFFLRVCYHFCNNPLHIASWQEAIEVQTEELFTSLVMNTSGDSLTCIAIRKPVLELLQAIHLILNEAS